MKIIENSPMIIFVLKADPDLSVESVSENICHLGYSPDDFVAAGMSYTDIFYDLDLDLLADEMMRLKVGEIPEISFECRILKNNGSIRWVSIRTFPCRNSEGNITHYESILIDITGKKHMEMCQKESNEYFQSIVNTIREPIMILDRDLRIVFASRSFYRLFGTTSQETEGRLLYDLGNGEWNIPKLRQRLDEILPHDKSFDNFEIEFEFENIGKRIMVINARKVTPVTGEPESILLALEDVTEWKETEAALKSSEKKYSTLVENGNDGIIIVQDDVLKFVNSKFCEITGYGKEEALGKQLLYFVPVDYFRMVTKRYLKGLNKENSPSRVYEVEVISKDNRLIPAEVAFSSIDHEARSAVMVTIRDISEKKSAQDALLLDESRTEALLELNQMTDASVDEIAGFALRKSVHLTRSRAGYIALIDSNNEKINVYIFYESHEKNLFYQERIFDRSQVSDFLKDVRQGPYGGSEKCKLSPIIEKMFSSSHLPVNRTLTVPVFDEGNLTVAACVWDRENQYVQSDTKNVTLIVQDMWRIINNKLAEEALRASEKKYSTLVEKGNDGIVIVQEDELNFVNSKFCEITGSKKEELIGRHFLDFFPVEYGRMILKRYNKCLKSDNDPVRHYEVEMLSTDGTRIPAEINFSSIHHEGKPAVMITIRDVTEQKEKEDELLDSLEVQKMLQNVIKTSPAIVFMWKAEKNWPVEFVSENIDKFGYNAEDFTSGKLLYGDIIHPDDLENVQTEIARRFEEGYTDFSQEYRIITRSGEVRWVDERTFMQADEEGNLDHYQGIIVDITDRKQTNSFMNIESDVGCLFSPTGNLQETFEQFLEFTLQMNEIDCGALYIVDEITGDLNIVVHSGLSADFIEHTSHYGANSMPARLFKTGYPIYKLHSEVISITRESHLRDEGLASTAIIPILSDGKLVAVMFLASYNEYEISSRTRNSIEAVAVRIGTLIGKIKDESDTRRSQKEIQNILESIEDFLFIMDYSGRILYTNASALRRLGYRSDELTGMNLVSLHSHNHQLEVATMLSDIIKGKSSVCTCPLMSRDGTLVYKETKFSRGNWNSQDVIVAVCRERPG